MVSTKYQCVFSFTYSRSPVSSLCICDCLTDDYRANAEHIVDGGPANVTIPSDLAPGQYLIRHEIIALHLATQLGGAEFYPSCTQVRTWFICIFSHLNTFILFPMAQVNVQGNQTATATSSEEVTFPGGYSDTDPGIYDPTVFDTPVQYTFPGPPLAALVTDSSSSPASSSGTPTYSSPPSTPSSATGTNPSPSSTGSVVCKLTSQQAFSMRRRRTRSVSRIMGDFFKGIHI